MGEVYRAVDVVRGRVVALKRLPPHLTHVNLPHSTLRLREPASRRGWTR